MKDEKFVGAWSPRPALEKPLKSGNFCRGMLRHPKFAGQSLLLQGLNS